MAYNQRLTGSTDRDCDTSADSGNITPTAGTTSSSTETTSPSTGTTLPPAETTTSPAETTLPPNTERETEASPNGRSRRRPSERGVHNDYLLIPDGFYSGSRFASKYCDKSLENIDDSTGNRDCNLYIPFFFWKARAQLHLVGGGGDLDEVRAEGTSYR